MSVARYGGADRYATSLLIAEAVAAEAGGSLTSAVLVSGERWTDAVVAAPIAGALGGAVLMTPPDELRPDALRFLQRAGVMRAVVIGPEASGGAQGPGRGVSEEVRASLIEAGISVERVSGHDQYRTGVEAARRLATAGDLADFGRSAIIASGEVFADALVAGPLAARYRIPVLLTPSDSLHPGVGEYLIEADIEHVVLMGGTAAVSANVQTAVEASVSTVDRIAGATRFETAALFAQYAARHGNGCFSGDQYGLARARVPFDSFSAAPLLAQRCAPVLLTDPDVLPEATTGFLDVARSGRERISLSVFGGDAAVSRFALDSYLSVHTPAAGHEACKPLGLPDQVTSGFPLPHWAGPPMGTVRVAALFMDFPDAPATISVDSEARGGLPEIEEYLESQSYGQLDMDFVVYPEWLRAEKPHTEYLERLGAVLGVGQSASAHAVELADPHMDFSDVDVVLTVFPSSQFTTDGNAGGFARADGSTMPTARANTTRYDETLGDNYTVYWGAVAAHEYLHALGLPDLYPTLPDAATRMPPDPPSGKKWAFASFGTMGLGAYFAVSPDDPENQLVQEVAEGIQRLFLADAVAGEMLGWHRWQLGWLDEQQVRCVAETQSSAALGPISGPGDARALAVVPLNEHEVIVIESRRKRGYNIGETYPSVGGTTRHFPGLRTEGVLVYTVDALIGSGRLPLKLSVADDRRVADDYPVLTVGESVTVRGHTITVTGDRNGIHTVSISKNP